MSESACVREFADLIFDYSEDGALKNSNERTSGDDGRLDTIVWTDLPEEPH